MAADGDPCCYRHFLLGLLSVSLEVVRSERVPKEQDKDGTNHRIDAALGADWRTLILGNGVGPHGAD